MNTRRGWVEFSKAAAPQLRAMVRDLGKLSGLVVSELLQIARRADFHFSPIDFGRQFDILRGGRSDGDDGFFLGGPAFLDAIARPDEEYAALIKLLQVIFDFGNQMIEFVHVYASTQKFSAISWRCPHPAFTGAGSRCVRRPSASVASSFILSRQSR